MTFAKRSTSVLIISIFAISFYSVLATDSITPLTKAINEQSLQVASDFIKKGLPVDLSKYAITCTKFTHMNGTADIAQFNLESKESSVLVTCYIQDNFVIGCNTVVQKGTLISDKHYSNIVDYARGFLERYQTYTKLDSTQMINSLENVDVTKNFTLTLNDLTLTVSKLEASGSVITQLSWVKMINGVGYTSLKIGFTDNTFSSFHDNRGIYTIGNTTIRINKDQSIDTAIRFIENYSYKMPDGTVISDFNVTTATADLKSAIRDSSILYPCWVVQLHLNQTYPGSVDTFLVAVWADTGQVFDYGHEDSGGGINFEPAITGNEPANKPVTEWFRIIIIASTVAFAVCAITIIWRARTHH